MLAKRPDPAGQAAPTLWSMTMSRMKWIRYTPTHQQIATQVHITRAARRNIVSHREASACMIISLALTTFLEVRWYVCPSLMVDKFVQYFSPSSCSACTVCTVLSLYPTQYPGVLLPANLAQNEPNVLWWNQEHLHVFHVTSSATENDRATTSLHHAS